MTRREGGFLGVFSTRHVRMHEFDWHVLILAASLLALGAAFVNGIAMSKACLLYTSPSPRDVEESRMPSSA